MVRGTTLAGRVERLTNPVYRHRLIQIAVDAVLIALAFYLAFRLRFLDALAASPTATRDAGAVDRLRGRGQPGRLLRLRPVREMVAVLPLPDMIGVLRACAVSTAIPAHLPALKPFEDQIPRSVVSDGLPAHGLLVGGARLLVRMVLGGSPVATPSGRPRGPGGGAGSGGQMVVRELQLNPNLGSRAIGFLDDDPRKRGMRLHGINVLGGRTRSGRSSTSSARARS